MSEMVLAAWTPFAGRPGPVDLPRHQPNRAGSRSLWQSWMSWVSWAAASRC